MWQKKWKRRKCNGVYASVLIVIYFFIGHFALSSRKRGQIKMHQFWIPRSHFSRVIFALLIKANVGLTATWLISFPLSLCKKRQFRIFAYIHFFQLLMFNYINKKHIKKELVSHPFPKRVNFWSQILNFVSMNCWKWRPNQYGINPN